MSVLEHAARPWAVPGGSHDAVVAALTERVQELEQLLDTVREHATTAERDRLHKAFLEAIESTADVVLLSEAREEQEEPVEMCNKEALLEALDRICREELYHSGQSNSEIELQRLRKTNPVKALWKGLASKD